jgi:hypothetical protein
MDGGLAMRSTDVVKDLIRHPYAWPGGYPKYAVTSDGATLCKECCRVNFKLIAELIRENAAGQHDGYCAGWRVIGTEINWESELTCDNCHEPIERAYG